MATTERSFAAREQRELATTEEARGRLADIRQFVRTELIEGQDYGTIPGTQKPSLWQPGAEKLTEKLMLAPTFDSVSWVVEDHERGAYMVDVLCRLIYYPTGQIVAECFGSAARDATDDKPNPSFREKGLARNTTIKMAQKSALVGAVLKAARLAVEFTQDVEDMTMPPQKQEGGPSAICPECGGPLRTGISPKNNKRWWRCDACDKFVNEPQQRELGDDQPVPKPEHTALQLSVQKIRNNSLMLWPYNPEERKAEADAWIQKYLGHSFEELDETEMAIAADELERLVAANLEPNDGK
ncbi:hypothetical protein LCGC14_0312910 [marine sediment metagenome]|uniref:Uncharacterized protein n=1 Tax=marine sediment metagenome TaxID=412755 RepID=A0A0F9TRR8_9ZZZZ